MIVGLVGALAIFLAVMFVAIWLTDAGGAPSDTRVRTLALGRGRLSMAEVPFRQRMLLPMVDGITRAVTNVLPAAFVARTEQRLTEAGKTLSLLTFVNAVPQPQQRGTNPGKVLRAKASQMGVKRRQRAEETARKMTIKMV